MTEDPPEGPDEETTPYRLPDISPDLRAMFDKLDALLVGMSRAEALAAAGALFFDTDGEPRLRQRLHLVRDGPVVEPGPVGSGDGAGDEEPTAADPAGNEPVGVRDIDLIDDEDRERADRMMEQLEATMERRRAERADGVVDLSRERFLRLRRRRGLPTPD